MKADYDLTRVDEQIALTYTRLIANVTPELQVPKSRGEPIAASVGITVILTFLVLAAQNLLHSVAVFPSALWVLFIAFVVVSNIRQSGLRGFAVAVLGAFSRKQLLVISTHNGANELEIGFRLFSSNIIERRVPVNSLAAVCCSTGQASDLAGRDVNDWSVSIWYWHRNPEREVKEKKLNLKRAGQAPIMVGVPQAKTACEALACEVVSFLETLEIPVKLEMPPC